ncbi:hypothetical protein [Aquabacterium sp.]|uniref:hypothetical protein n=1 Tax=Aquabacterium sp. TaxID=1872578 RepID=UPI003784959F
MNFKTTLLDDRLNALLIGIVMVLALVADADSLWAAADTDTVAVAQAVVPAPIV